MGKESIARIIFFTFFIGVVFSYAIFIFWETRNEEINAVSAHDEWIETTADYYETYEYVKEHHYSKDDRKKPTDETFYYHKYTYVVDGNTYYYTTDDSYTSRADEHKIIYYAKDAPSVSRANIDISGGIIELDIIIGVLAGLASGLWLGMIALHIRGIIKDKKGVDPIRDELEKNCRMSV